MARSEAGVERQAVLIQGYYNLCLAHGSLRAELLRPIPTKGTGSPKKWRQRTPGMAAEITDHVWKVGELLMFRMPPCRQQVAVWGDRTKGGRREVFEVLRVACGVVAELLGRLRRGFG